MSPWCLPPITHRSDEPDDRRLPLGEAAQTRVGSLLATVPPSALLTAGALFFGSLLVRCWRDAVP